MVSHPRSARDPSLTSRFNSLIGRYASLFGGFVSLFARLGNLTATAQENQRFAGTALLAERPEIGLLPVSSRRSAKCPIYTHHPLQRSGSGRIRPSLAHSVSSRFRILPLAVSGNDSIAMKYSGMS